MIKASDIDILEIGERFKALPDELALAIQSEDTVKAVRAACKNNLLTEEEKIEIVEQIVALVLLGFIRLDALSHEIDVILNLNNPKLATAIADKINDAVFAPIKTAVETNYKPPLNNEGEDEEIRKIIEEDIEPPAPPTPPTPPGAPKPSPPPQITPSAWTGAIKIPPPLGPSVPATPKSPTPQMPNQVSKEPPKPIASTPPVPSAMPTPLPLKTNKPFGGVTPSNSFGQAQGKPLGTNQDKEPAPKILQEEASFGKPLRQASGFSLNIPMPKSLETNKEAAPMKPAMLELGIQPPKPVSPPPSPKAMEGAARVVHYTELKTPLEPFGAPQGRQVDGKLIEKTQVPPSPKASTDAKALADKTEGKREVQEITAAPSPTPGGPKIDIIPPLPYGNSKFDRPLDKTQGKPANPPTPPPVASRAEPKMNDVLFRNMPTPPAIPPRPAPGTPPLPKPPISPANS